MQKKKLLDIRICPNHVEKIMCSLEKSDRKNILKTLSP